MKPAQLVVAALVGSPEADILDQAARAAAARRATVPMRDLELPEPAPEQEADQPTPAFVAVVGNILARPPASRDPLLVEALDVLAQRGLVLPTRLLVPVLEATSFSREIAAAAPPVLGARGRWLVVLHPRWLRGHAVADPSPEHWDEGTLAERIAWVRHQRGLDADAGRALVVEARKEKAADRAQFVAALEEGLSLADEELLEDLLRDRSKEVGRAAARLLARLDGSAYLARALALAGASFTPTTVPAKGLLGRLRAPKPGPVTATAPPREDGVADFHADLADLRLPKGPAGRVVALAAMIPPHRWAEIGLSLAELAEVRLDDEPVDLTPALAQATLRWRDIDAARTLLARRTDVSLVPLLPAAEQGPALAQVIRALDAEALRRFWPQCWDLLKHGGITLNGDAADAVLDGIVTCANADLPISDAACRLVAQGVEPAAAPATVARLHAISRSPKVASHTVGARYVRDAAAFLTIRHSIYESLKEPR